MKSNLAASYVLLAVCLLIVTESAWGVPGEVTSKLVSVTRAGDAFELEFETGKLYGAFVDRHKISDKDGFLTVAILYDLLTASGFQRRLEQKEWGDIKTESVDGMSPNIRGALKAALAQAKKSVLLPNEADWKAAEEAVGKENVKYGELNAIGKLLDKFLPSRKYLATVQTVKPEPGGKENEQEIDFSQPIQNPVGALILERLVDDGLGGYDLSAIPDVSNTYSPFEDNLSKIKFPISQMENLGMKRKFGDWDKRVPRIQKNHLGEAPNSSGARAQDPAASSSTGRPYHP